jgi:hypothetical protein
MATILSSHAGDNTIKSCRGYLVAAQCRCRIIQEIMLLSYADDGADEAT